MTARRSMPHLPALDGLRGLAVAGVLLFHLGGVLPGGYLGVDLFFVLSGYLITSLLLFEHDEAGAIALGPFWRRRARRLLPALFAMLPPIAAYARWVAQPLSVERLRGDMIATLAYVANWRAVVSQKSYWELFAAPSLLEHTWSLAIEEQFYVLWPLAVKAALHRTSGGAGRRRILGLALALAAASAASMVALYDPAKTSRVYLGTDTRIAAILLGAALAAALPPGAALAPGLRRALGPLALAALAGLGAAWARLDGQSWLLYHGGFWLTEIAALVVIAAAVTAPRSLAARALSLPPLRGMGAISYGLYLWHWPVFVVVTNDRVHAGPWLPLVRLAVTFAIAIPSYFLLERPIRRRGLPRGWRGFAALGAAGVALAVAVAGARPQARFLKVFAPVVPREEATFSIMVVGDSTASSLGWTLRGQRVPGLSVELKGQDACTMLADDMCFAPRWGDFTREVRPDVTLVFLGGAFMHGIGFEGRFDRACTPEWHARFEKWMRLRVPLLVAPKTRVYVVTVPYGLEAWETPGYWSEVDCINRSLRAIAASIPGVEVLDLAGYLCPGRVCKSHHAGKKIRVDGVHYDIEGAYDMSHWVLEQIGVFAAPPR